MSTTEFHSEYADVVYIEKDNVVLLTWKKRAVLDNYREPTTFSLELLKQYSGSNYIVDARDGFEDDKRDVEWGFSWLLPNMSKTTCQYVGFILAEYEETMDNEMDMWTKEFHKYFSVVKGSSYEEVKNRIGL